jgi:CheY-like chemotaxis protein
VFSFLWWMMSLTSRRCSASNFAAICAQRFVMDFANSAADALARVASSIGQSLILILSDINMPGMTGLEMLPKVKEIHRV